METDEKSRLTAEMGPAHFLGSKCIWPLGPTVLWETTCLHGGLRKGGGGYQGSGLYRHLPPRKAGALRPVALGIKSTWRPGPGPMAFWIGAPPFSGHLLRLLLLHNVTPIYLD